MYDTTWFQLNRTSRKVNETGEELPAVAMAWSACPAFAMRDNTRLVVIPLKMQWGIGYFTSSKRCSPLPKEFNIKPIGSKKNGCFIISTSQRERKYLPIAIPMVEETMIPVDKLTTTAPKSNANYEMIVNMQYFPVA